MKTNIIVTLFIILSAGCMVLTLATDGYLYLQGRHKVEIAAIEADHAEELAQLKTLKKQQAKSIANLQDKAVEEFYRGRFELCHFLMDTDSSVFCYNFTADSYGQEAHKQPPHPRWNWKRFKAAMGGNWQ